MMADDDKTIVTKKTATKKAVAKTAVTKKAVTTKTVAKAATDLAVNLSLHGYGVGYFAAVELQKFVREVLSMLSRQEVMAAYGTTTVWQLVERVSELYLGGSVNGVRHRTMARCQEKNQLMAIDLSQPHLVEYMDYCYKYKAPAEIPKYELGKVQWKIAKEEKKRQRRAALEAKMQNVSSYFLGTNEMEIRSKLNVATGVPTNRNTVTMFDAFRMAGIVQNNN